MGDEINVELVLQDKIDLDVEFPNTVIGAVVPITYSWPQHTGSGTSHRTGDDADIETSVFLAARVAGRSPKLVDFLTLLDNNSFGNKFRFTNTKGAQVYDGTGGSIVDYAIDNYTGLAWEIPLQSLGIWNTHIDNAVASTFGDFSDWFLPNVSQYHSIMQHQVSFIIFYDPFFESLSSGKDMWTSTTIQGTSTTKLQINNRNGEIMQNGFNASGNALYCRKHF